MDALLICLVIAIADGDTLTCLTDDRQQIKVRLAEIDAPEKKQPFGTRSRQSLGELCHEKRAEVRVVDQDRYGRTVGRVTCDGTDANAEQIHRGMAWVYDRYAQDKTLYKLQDEAKAARRGLWAGPQPMAPWSWRQQRTPVAQAGRPSAAASAVEVFRTEAEARAAGYRKAGNCR